MSASGKSQPCKGNGLVTVLESETFLFVADIKWGQEKITDNTAKLTIGNF
jgi:hypothetical protein